MAFRIFRQVRKKPCLLNEESFNQIVIRQGKCKHRLKSTAVLDEATTKTVQSETESRNGHPNIDLTFSSCQEAYRSKTNLQLLRAWLVLKLCSWTFLVDNNKAVRIIMAIGCLAWVQSSICFCQYFLKK